MAQALICHSCQHKTESVEKVGRQDTCPQCAAYLHCCLNCRFYDTSAYNECSEPMAERVLDKQQANFCDYFEPGSEAQEASDSAENAKQALEALFKKR